jgi:hypothetical protein
MSDLENNLSNQEAKITQLAALHGALERRFFSRCEYFEARKLLFDVRPIGSAEGRSARSGPVPMLKVRYCMNTVARAISPLTPMTVTSRSMDLMGLPVQVSVPEMVRVADVVLIATLFPLPPQEFPEPVPGTKSNTVTAGLTLAIAKVWGSVQLNVTGCPKV